MPRRISPIGAHVSVAGGMPAALPRAVAVGAEAIQVFVSSSRAWAPPVADPHGDAAFAASCELPVYVHAPYLINFGSPSAETLARSCECLEFSLRRAASVGARGVVLHAGSAVLGNSWDVAMKQVREHLLPLLDRVPSAPRLLVEPTAGGGGALAHDAASLGAYLDALERDERIGVCLDTCHVHAAGHDLSSAAAFATALRSYARAAGRGRIALLHVNDSRDPVGSRRDRHAAIGAGTIGGDAFAALFGAAGLRGVPMIVECPPDDQPAGIAALKALRGAAAV
jgi:deoxyribonuclease-4